MRMAAGFDVQVPSGWQLAARRQSPSEPGRLGNLLVHAATVALPRERGDFGSDVAGLLGPDDLFVTFFEYDREAAATPLFDARGLPRPRPADFETRSLQRVRAGQSGAQYFFSEGGRAWCLFAILGSHSRRQAGAVRLDALLRGTHIR